MVCGIVTVSRVKAWNLGVYAYDIVCDAPPYSTTERVYGLMLGRLLVELAVPLRVPRNVETARLWRWAWR
jgi:hypothetical protein